MEETIKINRHTYKIEQNDSETKLSRYDEKYKMWVNLYFPIGKPGNSGKIIEVLSKLYIERQLAA